MQKLQLTIPEPCHENWQQMTPTQQGRFCNACAKEVIDFSTMTDIQVLNYFTNLTNEKVCGRALPEQLDRTLSRPEPPKKRLFWYWNYFVMFLIFFGKGNTAKAQTCVKPATELTPADNLGVRGQITTTTGKRVISGKVTDGNGVPISFASVQIKGTKTGVSADANGAYSIRVNSNALLIISGSGYKEAEVPVGNLSVITTVLEKVTGSFTEGTIVVTVGGIGFSNMDEYYGPLDKLNRVAVLRVKDEETGKAVPGASFTIKADYAETADTAIADNKGMHKIKGIKDGDGYAIKVTAEGYEPNEFTIEEYDFKNRKKEWVVLLKKQAPVTKETSQSKISDVLEGKVPGIQVRSQSVTNLGKETQVRVGGISFINPGWNPIYVIDGKIMPDEKSINTDNVEDISFLNAKEATALYGAKGANGAVIVTNKKLPVRNLDTVTVTAFSNRLVGRLVTTTCTTTSVMGAMIKGVSVKSSVTDSLKTLATKITGAIKVYPNPVQRGESFNVALKLKQAGLYFMQVTDATGRIMLQKHINANFKEHTEQVMPDSRWSSGAYYVSIIDSKNKLVNKSGFIFR